MKRLPFLISFLLIILLPWHAFLITWFSHIFLGSSNDFLPKISLLIASWKEILTGILGLFFLWKWGEDKQFPVKFEKFDWIFLAFFCIAIFSGIFLTKDLGQMIWGFKYDFFFFVLFYIIRGLDFSEKQKNMIFYGFLGSATLVLIWGLLNYFIFPKDFLLHFGYSDHISSYDPKKPLPLFHTIEGSNTIRLASSFSGPNQYGFYLITVIAFLITYLQKCLPKQITNYKLLITHYFRKIFTKKSSISNYSLVIRNSLKYFPFLLLVLATISLILTYSRSALLGIFTIISIHIFMLIHRNKRIQFLSIFCSFFILIGFSLYILYPQLIEKSILRIESSGGHYERSMGAIKEIIHNPIGTGLGTAGPASIRKTALHTVYVPESSIIDFMKEGLSEAERNEIWFYDNNPHGTIEFKPHNTTELKKIPDFQKMPEKLRNDIFTLWKKYYHERIAENWHLQMFQEFGWIGGILWFSFLFSFLSNLINKKSFLAYGGFLALIGLSMSGLFLHSFEDASTSLSLFLLLGLAIKNT